MDMEIKLVGLAIIHKEGKVLIGQRKEKDEFVEHLSWVFPGGEFATKDFEKELIQTVKKECGLDIKINNLIFARKPSEASIPMVLFYFDCSPIGGQESPEHDLNKLEWIPATLVAKYFSTSVADRIMEFLKNVEDNKL